MLAKVVAPLRARALHFITSSRRFANILGFFARKKTKIPKRERTRLRKSITLLDWFSGISLWLGRRARLSSRNNNNTKKFFVQIFSSWKPPPPLNFFTHCDLPQTLASHSLTHFADWWAAAVVARSPFRHLLISRGGSDPPPTLYSIPQKLGTLFTPSSGRDFALLSPSL